MNQDASQGNQWALQANYLVEAVSKRLGRNIKELKFHNSLVFEVPAARVALWCGH